MEGAPILGMFSVLLAAFVSLFGWTLMQTNRLGAQQVGMSETVRTLVLRIDVLVAKLDANFTIQINEQVARNVLQEKVANIERILDERRERERPRPRRDEQPE